MSTSLPPNLKSTNITKSSIISEEQLYIMSYVGYVFMSSATCIFGIPANCVNIIIFLKQGFKSSVNITLFGISISDLAANITLQWVCICMIPFFRSSKSPFAGGEFNYLTGGLPLVFFTRVTSWFIAFVTMERCLSVILPLKVKRIITPRRTVIYLLLLLFLNFLSFIPVYLESYLGWKFYEDKNRTMLGLIYNKEYDGGVISYALSPIFGLGSIALVIVFTVILVFTLQQKSKWRQSVSHDKEQVGLLSNRDKITMKMVILLASVLIACNIPSIILASVTIFESDFDMAGAYEQLFLGTWSFAFFFQGVNASVNIFFYYRMSSNYRQSLDQLFARCRPKV